MARRTKQQWQELVTEFESSGQSQANFCKHKQLNPKYFSLKRSKLLAQLQPSDKPFAKAVLSDSSTTHSVIEIKAGRVTLLLPPNTPVDYITTLIWSLA